MCGPTTNGTTTNDEMSEEKTIENVAQNDEPTNPSSASVKSEWPEDTQGLWWPYRLYLRWTYAYLSPLLTKGSQQHQSGDRLDHADLFPVPDYMSSQHLSPKFREFYYGEKGQRNVFKSLWLMIRPIYIAAGIFHLITVLCQSANPLIVRALLGILEDNPSEKVVDEGLPFAIALFLVLFVNGVSNHRHRHLSMKSGVLMRSALVNVIYEHVLHLTPKGRANLSSGEVSTLVAVDTQKIFEAAQEGHLIWSLPLSIALVTTFLLLIMGPVTLVGIAVLVCFLPVGTFVTAKMLAIRKKRVHKTDERIDIVSSLLQGMRIAKLNNYEDKYNEKITQTRNEEMKLLSQELAVWAITLSVTVFSPMLATAATFAVYVLIDEDNVLTAARTFSVLLLFAALRFPINYAARFLGKAAQAISALERISTFLEREANYHETSLSNAPSGSQDESLVLERAAFEVADSSFQVSEFYLSIKRGQVVAVCGPVGSGKSTLVNGVIHEVSPSSEYTKVVLSGRIAYVPQSAFIINDTFRENILFGLPFDKDKYEKVVDSCCLRADIDQLGSAQDLTQIGERGVTLSGGQKQRVALARAAYSSPDVVLLDDPLSALDAGTSKLVFDRLIKGRSALFGNSAVMLVTHASHFLNLVDRILIVVEGSSKFYGTWSELASFEASDEQTKKAVNHIRSSVQEDAAKHKDDENDEDSGEETDARKVQKIMTVEEREYGLSSLRTWLLWFKHAGGTWFLLVMVFSLAGDRFFYVSVEYWIATWTDGAEGPVDVFGTTFAAQSEGRSAQYDYLKVLASLVALSTFFTILRSEYAVTGGTRTAKTVHAAMLKSVLQAPMSYFETTPLGRILNRFSYDIEIVDVQLTEAMSIFMISISWFIAGVSVMITIVPWMVLALVPVVMLYLMVLLHYRKSGVDLQRLDAMSRSPVQAMVSEVLDGASSIRVFERQGIFVDRFRKAADTNSSALLNFVTAQRWLGVRIESMGALVSLAATTLVCTMNDIFRLDPGLVGLLIVWSSNFTITLGFLLDFFGEAEAAITAIERVDAMTTIPEERNMKTDESHSPKPSWPEHGELRFDNVCFRYRQGLPLVLQDLNFTIPAGKTCGVVGRTGAGKSSLTVALFRLVEIESGRILLDGVELGKLGLSDVRGRARGMSIIPQDPFLTGSTLRECVDPFGESTDNDVLEALRAVRMAKVTDSVDRLSTVVEEGGSNFSVGERQLLNLARALLSKPKVLVLDEATASVDGETDAFIQQMLRTRFQETTLLTIAHRLNTIMDYDLILVMDAGRAAEFGSPAELLESEGKFAELVDATGPESAQALKSLTNTSNKSANSRRLSSTKSGNMLVTPLLLLMCLIMPSKYVECTSSLRSLHHRRGSVFLDVDNTLYCESSLSRGIESQIVQGIHSFCQDTLNITASEADGLHRIYGSTVEGLSQTLWKDEDPATQTKQIRSFYESVYSNIDMRELVLAHTKQPGSSLSSTGYSHTVSRGRQPNVGLLQQMVLLQQAPRNQFILASNSPASHVTTIVQALGLCRLSGHLQLLTPDYPQKTPSSGAVPLFPTKAQPLAFFSPARLGYDPNFASSTTFFKNQTSCLIDDSITVLNAVASQLEITPILVNAKHRNNDNSPQKQQSQTLEKALAIALGWVDPDFVQMDDAQYLLSKNQVDFASLHRPTWNRFLIEIRSIMNSSKSSNMSSLTIVDLGAGLLSMLDLLLNGHGNSLASLGDHMKDEVPNPLLALQRIEYHAYEPNGNLAPHCMARMESMGFIAQKDSGTQREQSIDESDPSTARPPRTIQFLKPACNAFPEVHVKIVFDDFRRQFEPQFSTVSPDVIIGACFADLYRPSLLVRSILACFLGKPKPHQRDTLLYFPITFGGTTQFLPPQPEDNSIPSDTNAFRLYAKALTEELGHSLESEKLVDEIQNFGGRVLSQGSSDWIISPQNDRYLWNCMMFFFGTTAAPSIQAAGYDAFGWMERARTAKPVIQASNKDLLFRLPFLGEWSFPSATTDKLSDYTLTQNYDEIQFTAPRQVQVVQKPIKELGPNEVRIQSICSLVSSGTELKIFKGQFEDAALDVNIPSMQEERMAYPLSYGYCLVGRIVECGSNVHDENEVSLLGKMVFAFAAHASQVIVDRSAIQIVPDGIDPYDAIFMPSMETAIAIVHDAHVRFGERAAVFGQGIIGLLVTAVLRESNALVTAVDTIPARLAASAMMGATQTLLPAQIPQAGFFDVSIEVSGNYRALQSAIDQTMDHGRVILGSWYGSEKVQLTLDMNFHRSHKTFIVSQVSEIPPALTGTWSKSRRFGLAWDLVQKLRPSRLLTRTSPLSQAQEVYSSLERGDDLAIAFNLEQQSHDYNFS